VKRLRGWLFTLGWAISLMFLIAVVGIWIRSHVALDECTFRWNVYAFGNRRSLHLRSDRGGFQIVWQKDTGFPQSFDGVYWPEITYEHFLPSEERFVSRASKAYWFSFAANSNQNFKFYVLFGPIWPIAILAAILPALWLARARRSRKRVVAGLCSNCGYDLRASPERCPECGTPARSPGGALPPTNGATQAK
jgi:hypothetical protein